MGKYEVTQGQWRRVMNMSFRQHSKMVSSIHGWTVHGEGDTYPMYYVNWDDAQEFIRRLNALNDDYTYRLPSEAEWEYACRAKTTGDYPGNLNEIAWYGPNSNRTTHPVGTKQPNSFGLYDMLGNVWEWCEDYYQDSYAGAPTDGSARLEGLDKSRRVFRGGSWAHDESYLRSSGREGSGGHIRIGTLGFRVVAILKQPSVQRNTQ
jgi:formylglycine-generating enzyme required for sulfatase activity